MEDLNREYYEKHFKFWDQFFEDKKELEAFICDKSRFEDNIPKRMINNVQRLCELSDEMDKIKPGRKDLNIFFIVACIESLFVLSNKKIKKHEMIIEFYEDYIDEENKLLIEESINILDNNYNYHYKVSMEQFALLISAIRNMVAHEGIYWNFQFKKECKNSCDMINIINSKIKRDEGYNDITYIVGLKYSEFRRITIEGFIAFINEHIKENYV